MSKNAATQKQISALAQILFSFRLFPTAIKLQIFM